MWIDRKIEGWIMKTILGRIAAKLAVYLEGKKTVIGAINLVLWILIYAMPAFTPNYNWLTAYATQFRDLLIAAGVNLDNELFNVGVSFTVVGLVDKLRRLNKR